MAANDTPAGILKPKQHAAIAALMTSPDVAAAARKVSVGERTLRRWMREDADFANALKEAQRETMEAIVRRLTSLANGAVSVLAAVMNDEKASAASKVRAAEVVLDRLTQLGQQLDLAERIAALEADPGDIPHAQP